MKSVRVVGRFPVFLRKIKPLMKTVHSQSQLRRFGLGITLGLAAITFVHAQTPAPAKPSGPPKVRVIVKENTVASSPGGTSTATPAPAGAAKSPQGQGGKQGGAQAAAQSALDAEKFTRTTKKTLTVELVNLTNASIDVTAKTTFLAKDEGGKHDVVEEKTVENKVTLQPGKSGVFTTEEIDFTHTAAHHAAPAKPGAGGAGGAAGGRGKLAPLMPASGHAYFGYKVQVFQGSDLVGTAANETH
jgi:hypothetical protein